MNKYIDEIVSSVFKKNITDYFSSFNKEIFSNHINSLQNNFATTFQTNIKQTSFSQIQQNSSDNQLVTFAQQLRNTSRELLELRPNVVSALLDIIQNVKESEVGKLDGVISKEYTDNALYFGQDDNNKRHGIGYYAENDMSYVFIGEWEDDIHKSGILVNKRDKQNEVLIGSFIFTGNSYLFNGFYMAILNNPDEYTNKTLAFGYGNFGEAQKEVDGIVCFASNTNEDLDIYFGKLVDFKKEDDNAVLINFINKEVSFYCGGFSGDVRSKQGLLYKSENYLLELHYGAENKLEKASSTLLRLHDKSFFNGEISVDQDQKITIGASGTIVFNNNHLYQGGFSNGKKEGNGHYFIRSETNEVLFSFEATFKEDQMVNGTISKNNQGNFIKIYEGDFSNNAPSHGRYFYENSEVYEGDFVNNAREGKGRYNFADKCSYDGEWKANLKHGHGKYTDADNNVFEALWQNNHLTKIEKCTPANDDD